MLHPDRLLPVDPGTRGIARALFQSVESLPIVSPHGHTEPKWWGDNSAFGNPSELFVIPDHYVLRMLVSQGVALEKLGVGNSAEQDGRKIWRLFAEHYHLFRATPSRLWLDHAMQDVFGIDQRLSPNNADAHYDAIEAALGTAACQPRGLYNRFNIELIATTDSPLDDLQHHRNVAESDWNAKVIPTYRPDCVVDPDFEGFADNVRQLGELTACDISQWQGYLQAHRSRRAFFQQHGATATDHGHPTAHTANLCEQAASKLYQRVLTGKESAGDRQLFRAQMLTEMARMSIDDGLVMQLHPGSHRNHNADVFGRYGRDKGFDIPVRCGFVEELKPLLNEVGMDPRLTLILFTLDESSYARELAPLAGVYPALRLGPSWWFHDSFEGMRRYRERVTETAGFMNTAGFNDDTRALCSIPARHDVARRCDCAFLAELVCTHRLDEDEAFELAPLLANGLARQAYKLQ